MINGTKRPLQKSIEVVLSLTVTMHKTVARHAKEGKHCNVTSIEFYEVKFISWKIV